MPRGERSTAAAGLRPGAPLAGRLRAPGSKSIAQRTLVCAALAEGASELRGLPEGADVAAALAAIEAMGARVDRRPEGGARVEPPPGGRLRPGGTVALGESGTLWRLAAAALAFESEPGTLVELAAEGSLARRSSPALLDALRRAGVDVAGGGWPLRLRAASAPERVRLVAPTSSQEASALLIALAAAGGERELEVEGRIPSRPYVELTCAVLGRFGAEAAAQGPPERERFRVRGPLRAPGAAIEIEPDASLAAVALAAACLSGGEVTALGLAPGSAQGDVRIAEHLAAFGCRARWSDDGLRAFGRPASGARLDLSGEPDLAPVLAAVAADVALRGAGGSELFGLGTLPGKESSRIEVLAGGLARAGCAVEWTSDALRIAGSGRAPPPSLLLDPHGDHRMAFAFALLGLAVEGVDVADPGCVAKSWPSFWDEMERMGAIVSRT